MDVWTKFHGNPSMDIKNVNTLVALEDNSEVIKKGYLATTNI